MADIVDLVRRHDRYGYWRAPRLSMRFAKAAKNPTDPRCVSCRFSLGYERFEDSGFRSRTPGPPPFSAINSTPARTKMLSINESESWFPA
jgi:hypothetical protein